MFYSSIIDCIHTVFLGLKLRLWSALTFCWNTAVFPSLSFQGLLFGIFLLGDLCTSAHLGNVVIYCSSGLRHSCRLWWRFLFLLDDSFHRNLGHFLFFRNLGLFHVARFLLFLLFRFFSLGFWLLFLGSASWFWWLLLLFLLWFFFYFFGFITLSFIHHWHEHIRVSIFWLLSCLSFSGLFLNNCRLFDFPNLLLLDWLWFLLLDLNFFFFWSFDLWDFRFFLWLFFVRFANHWLLNDLVYDLNFSRITSRESWVEFYWRLPLSNRLLDSLFICLDSLKLIVFLFIIIIKIINFFDSI